MDALRRFKVQTYWSTRIVFIKLQNKNKNQMAEYFDLRQTLGGSENSVSAAVQFNGKFSRNTIPSPCMIWQVRSLSRTAPTRRTRHLKIVKSTGITSTVNFPLFELPQAAFAPNIRVVTLKHNLILERPIGGGLKSSKFL